MTRRILTQTLTRAVAALAAACSTAPALAAWPDKPISLVVPYAPGGSADALARLLAQHLGPRLKTTVVVLNKAGASGMIGQSEVARAPADGYTVLYDATPLSINPHLQKLPYDPDKVKERFDALGSRIVASSPEEFRKFLAAERTRWAETVKAAGIKKE